MTGPPAPSLVVGTAGHVDHGKTWLVRALTGTDTDRLPEERRRGISIELGYAPLDLPDGRRLSLVDVPGHERFVRTMVAGATGIDLFLLVVDAGEGARPQTHEHLAILRLLGVERGVVAVTKADAVDPDVLELALEEARELVPGAEALAVSAATMAGLEQLRDALARAADGVAPRPAEGPARLHVDRSFSLHGVGTVVTGTLRSGTVAEGDELELEPAGRRVRVRSLQVHDRPTRSAGAGRRVALNLSGVERREVRRGDALVTPGSFPRSYRLDVALTELAPLADGDRLLVHHGTARIPARLVVAAGGRAQLRLAEPVVAARGDRVVLRRETTVGGAVVLDPAPPRHRDPDRLRLVEEGAFAATIDAPVRHAALQHLVGDEVPAGVVRAGGWLLSPAWLERLEGELRARIEAADPLDPGVPAPSEPWAADVLPLLPFERRGGRLVLPGGGPALAGREAEVDALLAELAAAGGKPVRPADPALARVLEGEGRLVRLGEGLAVSADAYEVALDVVVRECERAGEIALARFRDLLGVGRRDAQLLLERFDADGVTRRIGDRRILRRAARRDGGPARSRGPGRADP